MHKHLRRQGNRKTLEGTVHPDRNAQFECINAQVARFQRHGQPVISVDTKKKELVGPYKNAGREWQKKGEPERVDIHDFPDPELGEVIPYGVGRLIPAGTGMAFHIARKAKEDMDESERCAIALQEAQELAAAQLAAVDAQSGAGGTAEHEAADNGSDVATMERPVPHASDDAGEKLAGLRFALLHVRRPARAGFFWWDKSANGKVSLRDGCCVAPPRIGGATAPTGDTVHHLFADAEWETICVV